MTVRGTPPRGQRWSRRARSLVILLLALCFALTAGGLAQAHVVKSSHWTYRSGEVCTYATSEVSHGDYGLGYTKASVDIYGRNWLAPPPWWDCNFPNFYPPGYIALKVHWDKWDGHAWQLCAWWDWRYNDKRAMWVWLDYHFDKLYCGEGTYRTYAGGYVYYNGEWKGGWHPSNPGHTIPTTPTRKEQALMGTVDQPGPPPGVGPLADDYPEVGPPAGPPPTTEELARMPSVDRPPDGFGPAATQRD